MSAADRKLLELERRVIGLSQENAYQSALKLVDEAVADPSLDRSKAIRRLVTIASGIARIIGDLNLVKRYSELRLTCDPDSAIVLYTLADCLAMQGETDQATKFARQSYELSLAQSDEQGKALAELFENRFPGVRS